MLPTAATPHRRLARLWFAGCLLSCHSCFEHAVMIGFEPFRRCCSLVDAIADLLCDCVKTTVPMPRWLCCRWSIRLWLLPAIFVRPPPPLSRPMHVRGCSTQMCNKSAQLRNMLSRRHHSCNMIANDVCVHTYHHACWPAQRPERFNLCRPCPDNASHVRRRGRRPL